MSTKQVYSRSDQIDEVGALTGLSPSKVAQIIHIIQDTMVKALRSKRPVIITGFGKFSIGFVKAHNWAMSGKLYQVPDQYYVRFKPHKELQWMIDHPGANSNE